MRLRPVLAGLALLLTAAAAPAMAAKDELVIGISQFPGNFNPNIDSMMAKSYVLAMARRPFTVYDTGWNLICMLCTELPEIAKGTAVPEKTADGKDGIALTYTIRPDAVWGDGVPVTTKDVVFTWEVGRHPKTGVASSELYERITAIDMKDDKTFTMHINKMTCDYQGINDFTLLPAHIEKPNFADPAEYKTRSAYETDTTNPGLWFGPYRVTEVSSGSHVVLEPNPTWWGRKPHFKRIVVKAVENTAALTANLLSGDVDMIAGELGMTLDQALQFEKRYGGRYAVVYKPGLIYEHIDLNLDNPILQDRRVRRALIHAIDREAISQQLFEGKQPVAHGQTNPLDRVYYGGIPKYDYDPAKAGALLDAAGWKVGDGGIRRNAAGEKLQLEIMTTAGNKTRELVQQAMQSQWKQAGIDVRIRNEPPRVFFGKTVNERKFTAMAMFAWISSPENIPRSTLHSDEIPTAENGWAGQNNTGFNNPEMDKTIDDMEVVCEPQANQALWNRMQSLYAEELPVIPLYFRANAFILPKWLNGVVPTGHQYPTSLWVENWSAE
jgi:peptide/nickel transport system substrate-binding protein